MEPPSLLWACTSRYGSLCSKMSVERGIALNDSGVICFVVASFPFLIPCFLFQNLVLVLMMRPDGSVKDMRGVHLPEPEHAYALDPSWFGTSIAFVEQKTIGSSGD